MSQQSIITKCMQLPWSEADGKKNTNQIIDESQTKKAKFFWFWRHPISRIVLALLITFLNFYIYAVDPVCESKREVALPIIGSLWSLIAVNWSGYGGWLLFRFGILLIAFV